MPLPTTREEVIEFTKSSGTHLRTDGTVKTQDFRAWLCEFMACGTEHKEAVCDRDSFIAVFAKADTKMDGFRRLSDEQIQTPYGPLRVVCHEPCEGVTVYDRGIYPNWIADHPNSDGGKFFGWSDPIKAIV